MFGEDTDHGGKAAAFVGQLAGGFLIGLMTDGLLSGSVATAEVRSLSSRNTLNGISVDYEVAASNAVSGEKFLGGMAELKEGFMDCAIYLKDTEGQYLTKPGTTTGSKIFNTMYNKIEAAGGQINGIRGNWSAGDNLKAFNDGILNGLTPQEAAKGTFTGGEASSRGYTNVNIIGIPNSDGTYNTATVEFTKLVAK